MSRLPFYDNIELTPDEEAEAILQGKIKKYFATKNAPYWAEKENANRLQSIPAKLEKRDCPIRAKPSK